MRELIKQKKIGRFTVSFFIDGGEIGSNWFNDLYTLSPHIAGTTIRVPEKLQGNNGHDLAFYIGQMTPAELSKEYAKQGRKNPSFEAYESLQNELGWYITAADYSLVCVIEKNGIELSETYGITFDFSWEYADQSVEEYVISQGVFKDYGRDLLSESINEARSTIEKVAA